MIVVLAAVGTRESHAAGDHASAPVPTMTPKAVRRLLQNQVDIGNAVKPYYGNAGGKALTKLLKTHINTAVATVLAAKSGDVAGAGDLL